MAGAAIAAAGAICIPMRMLANCSKTIEKQVDSDVVCFDVEDAIKLGSMRQMKQLDSKDYIQVVCDDKDSFNIKS